MKKIYYTNKHCSICTSFILRRSAFSEGKLQLPLRSIDVCKTEITTYCSIYTSKSSFITNSTECLRWGTGVCLFRMFRTRLNLNRLGESALNFFAGCLTAVLECLWQLLGFSSTSVFELDIGKCLPMARYVTHML